MPGYLITAELTATNGFPEDSVVNSFAIYRPVPYNPATDTLFWSSPISHFYNHNSAANGNGSVAMMLGTSISRAANSVKLKLYDITGKLDGSPHGSPIDEDQLTLEAEAGGGTVQHPRQCAVVITLRGGNALEQPVEAGGNIRPRARQSGRLYVGPTTNYGAENAGGIVRPGAGVRGILLEAVEQMADQFAADNTTYCVWSRSSSNLYAVNSASVDDVYDTQRRRCPSPTVRTQRTFIPAGGPAGPVLAA